MASLKDKIESGLNDVRSLILGSQVLIGAGFRVFFEPDLPRVPHGTQVAQLAGLSLMILGLGPLLLPAAFHQIAEDGEETLRINQLTSTVLDIGLLPFALGLGVGLFMVAQKLAGNRTAWISGMLMGGFAVIFWYGAGYMHLQRKTTNQGGDSKGQEKKEGGTSLSDKIKQLLMETRMVLPGTQALLGFQIVIFLMQDFDRIPAISRWTHFGSLIAVSISAVLLIAPAAYHRIAYKGEESEEFRSIASRFMLLAMFFLGLGLAGDLFVVTYKVTRSLAGSASGAATLLAFFYCLWFVFPRWKRRHSQA